MKSLQKLFILLLGALAFFTLIFISVSSVDMEGEQNSGHDLIVSVKGWGYNTTRNTSQYISNSNASAHMFPEHFCDHETLLLIMVCSGPSNMEARDAIRATWGRKRNILGNNVSLFFLLGETANYSLQYDVMLESDRYGDIIQERFIDSYNNLTLKSVVMLKLVSNYCTNTVKYLLKIDDDMFVNVHLIVQELLARNKTTDLLMGKLICGARPIKDTSSKWYSPQYMYQARIYPNYLSGTGYMMSVDVAKKLYSMALKTPIFHLEDVYVTGICAKKANVRPRNDPLFTYQELSYDICLLQGLHTAHRFTPEQIRKTFALLHKVETVNMCQERINGFSVNSWILNNILKVNYKRRKSKCE